MTVVSSPIPRLVGELRGAEPRIVLDAVKAIRKQAQAEARRVTGGDGRLSNAGKKGARLRTRDTWRAGASTATVHAVPPAPWRWVTDGTGPHLIGVGRASRRTGNYSARRFKGRKVLRVGGRLVTGPVAHPGSRGKGAWTNVRRASPALVRKAAQGQVARFVRG